MTKRDNLPQAGFVIDFHRGYSILTKGTNSFFYTGSTRVFTSARAVKDDIDAKIAITVSAHFNPTRISATILHLPPRAPRRI